MTIYIDADSHCHVTDDGTMTPFETEHFYGKCDAFIEGHMCVFGEDPHSGVMIAPWKDIRELEAAQIQYERMMEEAAAAYREGVDSV